MIARESSVVVGIQGGLGSFNHTAALQHLPEVLGDEKWRLEFLHTARSVFAALRAGSAQFGQFAFWNSTAGPYVDCLDEFARNRCEIVARYKLPIRHSLLHSKRSRVEDLRSVITHRDVLKQCGSTLQSRYPSLEVSVGTGELEDPSMVAEAIADGRLTADVATVSNGLLAQYFDLVIGDPAMADDPSNESTFLLVKMI